jgi:hypothetical protein
MSPQSKDNNTGGKNTLGNASSSLSPGETQDRVHNLNKDIPSWNNNDWGMVKATKEESIPFPEAKMSKKSSKNFLRVRSS